MISAVIQMLAFLLLSTFFDCVDELLAFSFCVRIPSSFLNALSLARNSSSGFATSFAARRSSRLWRESLAKRSMLVFSTCVN